MEIVFRAIADLNRRRILDELHKKDGLTLAELDRAITEMTRFGVMKHLRILERARLVTTRKMGRKKYHYLNPMPLQMIHDRWLSKYTAPPSHKAPG